MKPSEVPDELVERGRTAHALHLQQVDARYFPSGEERVRVILAAVLPAYTDLVTEERDRFADVIAWEIQLHTQGTNGRHRNLDLRACEGCRKYRELRELPSIRAAERRLFQGIADALKSGNFIGCSPPEDRAAGGEGR